MGIIVPDGTDKQDLDDDHPCRECGSTDHDTLVHEDADDIGWLNGNGLRVHPASHAVHTASCRTQAWVPGWGPPMALPWPKYATDRDHACKVCNPDLGDLTTLMVGA